ncbi:CU044_2847 family protein [Agromyces sp. NPDC056379]|uniref:CU044_2847 family protein n=1 Tax=unclassified Agromyces TaxID=2639701 RepID=UPI0035E12075
MPKLVTFPSADGGEVTVQVQDADPFTGVAMRGMTGDALVQRANETIDDAIARIKPAVRSLLSELRSSDAAPDDIEVAFGIQMSAEVGAFVAAASSTANFSIKLRWTSAAAST